MTNVEKTCFDSSHSGESRNPVRVRVHKPNLLNSYKMSSFEAFIDPQPILRLVNDNEHSARKIYGRLLQKARSAEPENALEHEGAVEKFCVRLADHFPGLFRGLVKKSAARPETPSLLELTELEKRLRDLGRSRARSAATKKEKKYIAQQLAARGFKKTEIAQRMGVSRRAIYDLLHSYEGCVV
jgi:putative transposase